LAMRNFALGFWLVAQCLAEQVRVPGGLLVDDSCITEVTNGATLIVDDVGENRTRVNCPLQKQPLSAPQIQIYAADAHWQSQEPITSVTANWEVPQLPKSIGRQVVYFWPGLKSKQPEMGYPVLQPVLQFGESSTRWELQSWFVDARSFFYPVVRAPAILVNPGDKITSSMQLSADGKTWTIAGIDMTTGQDSTLRISHRRAGGCDYNYAMLVNENINVDSHCELMPANSSITFSNVSVNSKKPEWTLRANCANDTRCDCGNKASVDTKGDVILSWKNTVAEIHI